MTKIIHKYSKTKFLGRIVTIDTIAMITNEVDLHPETIVEAAEAAETEIPMRMLTEFNP